MPLRMRSLQFIDRFDSDVAQESAGHLGEGAFDEIKPGAMLGCVNVLEAPGARGEIGHGLPGDVGRMVVQHHADDGLARIVLVQALEQRDELHTAVAVLDVREDVTRVQVDSGEDRYRAPTDILIVAPYGGCLARYRRQIRSCQSDRLNTRLLVDADGVDAA